MQFARKKIDLVFLRPRTDMCRAVVNKQQDMQISYFHLAVDFSNPLFKQNALNPGILFKCLKSKCIGGDVVVHHLPMWARVIMDKSCFGRTGFRNSS